MPGFFPATKDERTCFGNFARPPPPRPDALRGLSSPSQTWRSRPLRPPTGQAVRFSPMLERSLMKLGPSWICFAFPVGNPPIHQPCFAAHEDGWSQYTVDHGEDLVRS